MPMKISVKLGAVIQVAQYQDIRPEITIDGLELTDDVSNAEAAETLFRAARFSLGEMVEQTIRFAIPQAANSERLLETYVQASSRLRAASPAFIWLERVCPDIARRMAGDVLDMNNQIVVERLEQARLDEVARLEKETAEALPTLEKAFESSSVPPQALEEIEKTGQEWAANNPPRKSKGTT